MRKKYFGKYPNIFFIRTYIMYTVYYSRFSGVKKFFSENIIIQYITRVLSTLHFKTNIFFVLIEFLVSMHKIDVFTTMITVQRASIWCDIMRTRLVGNRFSFLTACLFLRTLNNAVWLLSTSKTIWFQIRFFFIWTVGK